MVCYVYCCFLGVFWCCGVDSLVVFVVGDCAGWICGGDFLASSLWFVCGYWFSNGVLLCRYLWEVVYWQRCFAVVFD